MFPDPDLGKALRALERRDAIHPPADTYRTAVSPSEMADLPIPRMPGLPAEGIAVVTIDGKEFRLFAKEPIAWRARLFALRHALIITALLGLVIGAVLGRVIP